MNPDDMRQIEETLRAMPLREPPERLDRRVAQLGRAHRLPRRYIAAGLAAAAALAIAAGIVLMLLPWWRDPRPGETAGQPERPANGSEDTLPGEIALAIDDLRDNSERFEVEWPAPTPDGVVTGEDGRPMLQVRRRTVRTVQLVHKKRDARVEWNIPREEEVVLVPLDYN